MDSWLDLLGELSGKRLYLSLRLVSKAFHDRCDILSIRATRGYMKKLIEEIGYALYKSSRAGLIVSCKLCSNCLLIPCKLKPYTVDLFYWGIDASMRGKLCNGLCDARRASAIDSACQTG